MTALLVAGAVLAIGTPSTAAIDVHGTWLLQSASAPDAIVDVTQTGDAVSFPYGGLTVTGTLSDAGRLQVAALLGNDFVEMDGDVTADGTLLQAAAVVGTFTPLAFWQQAVFGQRCACSDGNTTDGDGCSATCQVEPCWSCTGTPSTCAPAPEGAACEQSACTTGAICTAGACGGGVPVAPCVDLTGSWWVHAVTNDPFGAFPPSTTDFIRTIVQRGGHLVIDDPPARRYVGSIDAAAGTFSWTRLTSLDFSGLCSSSSQAYRLPFSGSASSNDAFQATGIEAVRVSRCPLPADVVETATRGTAPPTTTTTTPTTTSTTVPDLRTPIPARRLSMRDPAPVRRRLALKSVTRAGPSRITVPGRLGPGDPTLHGATLDVYRSAGPGDHVRVALPAEGWRAIGDGQGYRYARRTAADPVAVVTLAADRLRVRAGGPTFGYTLDEARQGRIAVELRLGSLPALCADVPAESARSDLPGRFVGARDTPAPLACPSAP